MPGIAVNKPFRGLVVGSACGLAIWLIAIAVWLSESIWVTLAVVVALLAFLVFCLWQILRTSIAVDEN